MEDGVRRTICLISLPSPWLLLDAWGSVSSFDIAVHKISQYPERVPTCVLSLLTQPEIKTGVHITDIWFGHWSTKILETAQTFQCQWKNCAWTVCMISKLGMRYCPFCKEKVLVGTFSEYCEYQCTSMPTLENTSAAAVMTRTVILSTKNS